MRRCWTECHVQSARNKIDLCTRTPDVKNLGDANVGEVKSVLLSASADALPASQVHNLLSSGNDRTGNWTKLFSMCFAV